MQVAIQGQQASFHHSAARRLFGDDVKIIACDSFAECFQAVETGTADKAVVAIENSLYGSINPVYDMLLKRNLHITGEVYLHIEQCLIGLPDSRLEDISEVHSQVMALVQSERYLDENLPHAKRVEEHDTTASVRMVKEWNDRSKAAIASSEAAELYGMQVLARGIETNRQNYTRFVVLSRSDEQDEPTDKTSLVLHTPADTRPGSLYHALGVFASRDINLLLVHSRPVTERAWHYLFYIDVAADAKTDLLRSAIDELAGQGWSVDVLGTYRNGNGISTSVVENT